MKFLIKLAMANIIDSDSGRSVRNHVFKLELRECQYQVSVRIKSPISDNIIDVELVLEVAEV